MAEGCSDSAKNKHASGNFHCCPVTACRIMGHIVRQCIAENAPDLIKIALHVTTGLICRHMPAQSFGVICIAHALAAHTSRTKNHAWQNPIRPPYKVCKVKLDSKNCSTKPRVGHQTW
ncbi:hypothetical protein ABBQ32_14210 [Trebouxia sp. C0010 RCD-2024]